MAAALVQSLQVLVGSVLFSIPILFDPVMTSWLSPNGFWVWPRSLARSATAWAVPAGRGPRSRPALSMAMSRPFLSYQGPLPMRSMA